MEWQTPKRSDSDLTPLTCRVTLANRVMGNVTGNITKAANDSGESTLDDFIADDQLYVTSNQSYGGEVIALMNPVGIRANLIND